MKRSSLCYTVKIKWPFPTPLSPSMCRIHIWWGLALTILVLPPQLAPHMPPSPTNSYTGYAGRWDGFALLLSLTIYFPKAFTLLLCLWSLMLCFFALIAWHVLSELGDHKSGNLEPDLSSHCVLWNLKGMDPHPRVENRKSKPFFIPFWKFPFVLYKISEIRTAKERKYLKRSRFSIRFCQYHILFFSWNGLEI